MREGGDVNRIVYGCSSRVKMLIGVFEGMLVGCEKIC